MTLIRAAAIVGLLLSGVLAGCDIGMGPMMGGQPVRVGFESNGEQIYFTGISASGGGGRD